LSSADLMGRNLDRRVELMFPIEDPSQSQQIKAEVLDAALKADIHARILHPDGTYLPLAPANGTEIRDMQQLVMRSRIQGAKPGRHLPRESH
jgi:polyphosphate kinase